MATTKRYCIDCGTRLVYYPNLSNPKAPNEYRVLVYSCPDCTKTFEKPTLIAVKREKSDDPLTTMKLIIVEETKSGTKKEPPEKISN